MVPDDPGDLLRTNRAFAAGVVLLGLVITMAVLSFVSPYPPNDAYVVPPDVPPCWAYRLGTNSRGQDVFWQLTVAIRNTLAVRRHRRAHQPLPVADDRDDGRLHRRPDRSCC